MTAETGDRPAERWQSVPPEQLVWLRLDQDFIVFHRLSGITHFLNEASERLLCSILVQPKNTDSVVAEFMQDESSHDDEILSHMRSMLWRLEELGLVVRV